MPASGSCSGPGKAVCGGSRPLNPSGDDWSEALVGLVVEEGALAPKSTAAVEFTIKGTEATAACLDKMCANGEPGRDTSSMAAIGVGGCDVVVDAMFPAVAW